MPDHVHAFLAKPRGSPLRSRKPRFIRQQHLAAIKPGIFSEANFWYACEIQKTANGRRSRSFGQAWRAIQIFAQRGFQADGRVDERTRAQEIGWHQAKDSAEKEELKIASSFFLIPVGHSRPILWQKGAFFAHSARRHARTSAPRPKSLPNSITLPGEKVAQEKASLMFRAVFVCF